MNEGDLLFFKASRLYCKYVINIINNNIRKLKINSDAYKELDDKLYESYLKLEEILNSEFFDF